MKTVFCGSEGALQSKKKITLMSPGISQDSGRDWMTLVEVERCWHLPGRQRLHDPVLMSGCIFLCCVKFDLF